jgi:tRNA threonylcarbamoyladenosine biosynthesis protein TsaB
MNLLAIETATPACAVGVRTAAGLEVTRVVNEDRRHTEALVPAVAVLLHEVGLSPRDVTRVVVDRGPGLFTGLRVGVATAIAFAGPGM